MKGNGTCGCYSYFRGLLALLVMFFFFWCLCCSERDDFKHKVNEQSTQMQGLLEQNRALQVENEELPLLRDTVEEMKYLESKVVSILG